MAKIGPFDDLEPPVAGRGNGLRHFRPLTVAVRKQLFQERVESEQSGKGQDATVAVLNIGEVNDHVELETDRVYEKMALPTLDFPAGIRAMWINARYYYF